MTEDELKTLVCPVRRYCINEAAVIHDGAAPLYADSPCLGSTCAAFRRHDERQWQDTEGFTRFRKAGVHCGMGGEPVE